MKARKRGQAIPSYTNANVTSAKIILADIAKHGGEQSLAVRWARLVIAGAEKEPSL